MVSFRITVRVRVERAFLALVVLCTVLFLTVAVIKFTTVTEVETATTGLALEYEPVMVHIPFIAEQPEEEQKQYTHMIEEPMAGFALASTSNISEAYSYFKDLSLLAKLIHCEAGIDDVAGKLAVATVVMNRAEHWNQNLFGGPTLEGVIYHKLDGDARHQFSCIDDERLWSEEPGDDDYVVAKKVLDGYRTFNSDYLYYYNPELCNGIPGIYCDLQFGKHVFGIIK